MPTIPRSPEHAWGTKEVQLRLDIRVTHKTFNTATPGCYVEAPRLDSPGVTGSKVFAALGVDAANVRSFVTPT